jgi:hypothetical protein
MAGGGIRGFGSDPKKGAGYGFRRLTISRESVPISVPLMERRTDPNESVQWLVAEPSGLPTVPEKEMSMVLGG